MGTKDDFAIDVGYYSLSEPLQPYFTALYSFTITCEPGRLIEDQLHPEWAMMRFIARGPPPVACIGPGSLEPKWPFVVSGPTSKAIRFGLQRSRIWGLGLLPAGYARFVPVTASEIADTIVDGRTHPAFASFAPLLDIVSSEDAHDEATVGKIEAFLLGHAARSVVHQEHVLACQNALRDAEVTCVADLCERVGLSRRSLERLCIRYFGFPPKMLLRRQRFLRSLAQFTVAGADSWSRALDGQYYDQAHFVHDFRAFMGMTPSEYAEMRHPILERIMERRMIDQGALPATDLRTLLRYAKVARRRAL